MKKLVLSLLFAASIVGVKAQKKETTTVDSNKWIITAGVNAVDMRTPKKFGKMMKDYIGTSDLNFSGIPFRVTVERSLNKAFSMQIGASFNNIEKPYGWNGKDPKRNIAFVAFDGKLKYDLNSLIGETGMFDPYIETGFGVTEFQKQAMVNLKAGAGFNVWFSDKWGANANTSYNHNFEASGNDYFQHSLGLAYRFTYPSEKMARNSQLIHNSSKWLVSFGANFLDVRHGTFDKLFKDYFNGDFEDVNASLFRATVERKFFKGLGAQLGFSMGDIDYNYRRPRYYGYGLVNGYEYTKYRNRIGGADKGSYWNVDLKATYDINNLVGETAWFDPFINLGVGYSKLVHNSDFKINAGYGANFWLLENIGIKAESSYNHAFNHKGTDFFQHSAGLVYRFGATIKDTDKDGILDHEDDCPEVAGLEEFKGCPDSDKDGVADKDDKCPDVAGKKELEGCPDEDNDGVADNDDKCPKVAGPKENNGCPWPDTDGDGITDNVDKCPEVAGVAEEGGCPKAVEEPAVAPCAAEMSEINSTEIYFDIEKSYIKSSEKVKLDRVVEIIKTMDCEVELIFLSGFADPSGPQVYNLGLSKRRAKAVKTYLINKGVTNITVQEEGMGETDSREENKFNRRVEIRIN